MRCLGSKQNKACKAWDANNIGLTKAKSNELSIYILNAKVERKFVLISTSKRVDVKEIFWF